MSERASSGVVATSAGISPSRMKPEFGHAAEHIEQGIIISVGIHYYDRPCKQSELMPSHDLGEFVEGANAAGKGYCRA